MTHDQLCLGCKCEDGDHWIDCTCRCATIGRIREQIAKEIGKLELWKYAKNGKEELDLRLAIKDAIYGGKK